jgi:hypothetical protein
MSGRSPPAPARAPDQRLAAGRAVEAEKERTRPRERFARGRFEYSAWCPPRSRAAGPSATPQRGPARAAAGVKVAWRSPWLQRRLRRKLGLPHGKSSNQRQGSEGLSSAFGDHAADPSCVRTRLEFIRCRCYRSGCAHPPKFTDRGRVNEISDNGSGIPFAQAGHEFSYLGNSWKLRTGKTRERNRALHGKNGQGRFRAFGLGRKVVWETTTQIDGEQ